MLSASRNVLEEISVAVVDDKAGEKAAGAGDEHIIQLAELYQKADVVRELLKRRHMANLPDKDGRTLLHYAAWFGEADLIAELLANDDIQVNLPDERGQTPLHLASFHGRAAAVAQLLKHNGVDVNLVDRDGKAPLRLGVFSPDVVAEFIRHEDVNVNQQEQDGRTPLHHAVELDMYKSVAELLKHKETQVNLSDTNGWTPIALAGYHRSGRAAGELLKDKNLKVDLRNKYHWRAVCSAHKCGYEKEIQAFLRTYIANYYNRREKEGTYLTFYGKFFGVCQESKLAAAGFLLQNMDKLDQLEKLDDFSAHREALSEGELGSVFRLLRMRK